MKIILKCDEKKISHNMLAAVKEILTRNNAGNGYQLFWDISTKKGVQRVKMPVRYNQFPSPDLHQLSLLGVDVEVQEHPGLKDFPVQLLLKVFAGSEVVEVKENDDVSPG